MSEHFRRKTPDEILESISNIKRGRLKIILGAVSGSGKTYQMLLEGNELKERGIDVVVGVVNKSCSGTLEQLGSLELIPTIEWEQNGHIEQDIDLEKIYKRNPEVVLIDRLAHENHIHAKNATRLDDVKELINNEISVITTLNIYELKGVKKVAEQLLNLSLHVEVTLPEDTLTTADEVRLLDVTPEAILKRLQKGEISEKDEGPLQFYNNGNLATLRELSLRFLAEEVEEDLTEQREQEGLMGPSGATERILVCVQYHWNGSILIRRGDQIAKRLGGEFLIASFIPLSKKLSKEEEIFKSSMQKLVNKLNGRFFEITMNGDEIAEEIVQFSMQHQITRIILGQSKKPVWEELVNGSIVNKIMRKSKSIDVYIMADRVEAFGERIIPAIKTDNKKENPYRRLSNDEMHDKVERVIIKGTFKIFIGAAPGVGKTYTMLREANQLKENEMDVVIGLLEAHGRKETIAQVENLEILPKKRIRYKNVLLEEMDLDAIIIRNPEVVLIDELAHTNVPGNKNQKRYQDVMDILDAGISVISTMNIQHIESLKDSVKQITGVSVRETVPDSILQLSDELELIDISPNALRKRMEEGNIYAMDKVEQSLSHFFKTQNLIALRELALRELADDVDDRIESMKRKEGVRGPWRKDEVIFVCVNLRADSERLIRRGFRIAYRLKAEWYVIFVKYPNEWLTDEKLILDKLISLTHRLGGIFELYTTRDRRSVFKEIKKQLQTKKATQVILGQSARTRWQEIVGGSIVARLLREVRHLDVLIVAD